MVTKILPDMLPGACFMMVMIVGLFDVVVLTIQSTVGACRELVNEFENASIKRHGARATLEIGQMHVKWRHSSGAGIVQQ